MESEPDLFFISMAARLLGMHPQTLRKYERLGLIQPTRTIGSMRVYSREELERLKLIKRLVDDGGINLAGVQRLLSIADVIARLRPLIRDAPRRPSISDGRVLDVEEVLGVLAVIAAFEDAIDALEGQTGAT